jgi:superfamily II DNA or RNA helicase
MNSSFAIGQIVRLIADPSRSGPIIAILPLTDGQVRYRVFHSPTDIREYLADQIEVVDITPTGDRLVDALQREEWLPASEFQARLTAARLADPQIDHLYSLYSGRIQHIPFQFKPLLRFIRADQPRFLIADEVGVGKTIEAGLILKEFQSRQRVDNVLVLCPKALVGKWREEMRRFDEDFRPLSAENLRYCLEETHLDGVWPAQYSRAIVHLELLRQEPYLNGVKSRPYPKQGLLTLDPPPHFNLLIVDEAHHLRTPGTLSHQLARFLCDTSDAVIFLSATPVHVGSENLFTLLNLLRPDLFSEKKVFDQVVEPNQYLTKAMRSVRLRNPADSWQKDAFSALNEIKTTTWGREVISHDPIFVEWESRLSNPEPVVDAERIRCLRDLEEIHSLAHIINRTRRRDIGRFTIREPHTVTVPFTEQQKAFYDTLLDFHRQVLLQYYDPIVVKLITDTLQRQAASCLPALIPSINSFLRTGKFSYNTISDDPENEEDEFDLPTDLLDQARQVKELAQSLPDEDPKFDQLLKVIQETIHSKGPGKVLVFSYFLHTLHYLYKKLYQMGYRVGLVTGEVKDDKERELFRNRFRLPVENEEAVDILLSSEVGCEGLDYEFCDRLVNYDIPWNPMRIEQRIGRIDRFGQQAEKIMIFNFITPGTVEERIFFRCFERLGIFKDTLGDLEEVLGELIDDLTKIALDPSLSEAQAEELAQQKSDNLLRQVEEERRLEEESGAFLGVDQVFTDDIQTLMTEGRFVSPDDLLHMIQYFVELPEIGGKLTQDEKNQTLYRLRLKKESRQLLLEKIQSEVQPDRTTLLFTRWLQGEETFLIVTFDQKAALENRQIPFITPLHPLSRLAVNKLKAIETPLISCVTARNDGIPEGRYLFISELWDYLGIHPEVRMVNLCLDLEKNEVNEQVSSILIGLLGTMQDSLTKIPFRGVQAKGKFDQLDEFLQIHRREMLRQHKERNDFAVNKKIAGLEAWHRMRNQRLETELSATHDDRIHRMKEAERSNIDKDYLQKRKDLEGKKVADITTRRIAAGILEVIHGK